MSMIMPQKPVVRILALDTSSVRGSVALLEDRNIISELGLASLQTHSARLLTSIDFLLQGANWKLSDLDLIAAGIGPGSFTGIRIGVATALGLAQSLGIPFCGISGLDAFGHQYSFLPGRVAVIMDAQRSQVYYAEYDNDHGRVRRKEQPSLWHPGQLTKQLIKRNLFLVGDGAVRYFEDLCQCRKSWPRLVYSDGFLAGEIGRLALQRKRTWQSGESPRSEPLYIRPPDAIKPKRRI